jgi:hypothetical protein
METQLERQQFIKSVIDKMKLLSLVDQNSEVPRYKQINNAHLRIKHTANMELCKTIPQRLKTEFVLAHALSNSPEFYELINDIIDYISDEQEFDRVLENEILTEEELEEWTQIKQTTDDRLEFNEEGLYTMVDIMKCIEHNEKNVRLYLKLLTDNLRSLIHYFTAVKYMAEHLQDE